MILFDFIKRANPPDLKRMLLLTAFAGIANAFLVVMVNLVAELVAEAARPDIWHWLAFVTAFVVYYLCDNRALRLANQIIEGLLCDLRVNVAAKLRRTELQTLDDLGRGELYAMVSHETNHLSVAFPLLVNSFQQAILLAVSLVYLAYLSVPALLVFLVVVVLGIVAYRHINESFRTTLAELGRCQGKMLDSISDIIDGAKELILNTRRSEAVFADYGDLSKSGHRLTIGAGEYWVSMVLLSVLMVYSMLGIIGFIFPLYVPAHSTIVFQLVATLMFCVVPLTLIVAHSPMFVRAEVGLRSIISLEQQLDAAPGVDPATARAQAERYQDFQRISYRDLVFNYRAQSGNAEFSLGPLNLDVERGELIFLVGGNGSGKSTTLRLLTGLYPMENGQIEIDGTILAKNDVPGFRELFSAIFADFHLFDRLYGQEGRDPGEVNQLIREMGLSGKLRYVDGRFSELHLSTGQRKRLALIAALLEDRPIYIFDEWSAEQDFHFRQHFYTRILPELKAKGKTVIAVTHDDRFWHVADRVIKLDLGVVEWEKKGKDLEETS
jgi:putative pyoverdin transport system ATP-binding/permease protein